MRYNVQALLENFRRCALHNLNKHISLILKELRKKKAWSLDRAAKETGVSKAMLGQIERGESSPTIATLWKIASGFNTSFSSFIENLNLNFEEPIYRAGEAKQIHPAEKIRVMPLFPFDPQLNFEVFMIELLPGCEHLSPPHQEGVIEHVIIIEGTLEVLVNNSWKTLHKDEGLRFQADQPHGYRNIPAYPQHAKMARFYDIVHYLK